MSLINEIVSKIIKLSFSLAIVFFFGILFLCFTYKLWGESFEEGDILDKGTVVQMYYKKNGNINIKIKTDCNTTRCYIKNYYIKNNDPFNLHTCLMLSLTDNKMIIFRYHSEFLDKEIYSCLFV